MSWTFTCAISVTHALFSFYVLCLVYGLHLPLEMICSSGCRKEKQIHTHTFWGKFNTPTSLAWAFSKISKCNYIWFPLSTFLYMESFHLPPHHHQSALAPHYLAPHYHSSSSLCPTHWILLQLLLRLTTTIIYIIS